MTRTFGRTPSPSARTVSIAVALVGGLLAPMAAGAADAEKGKQRFQECSACHSLDAAAAPDNPGPTLEGVLGRKAGSRDDYRYSAAMRRSEIVWTLETVEAFVADPQGYLRGNRMAYAGMPDAAARADLMAYLAQVLEAK